MTWSPGEIRDTIWTLLEFPLNTTTGTSHPALMERIRPSDRVANGRRGKAREHV
jgi:hypothetical protein